MAGPRHLPPSPSVGTWSPGTRQSCRGDVTQVGVSCRVLLRQMVVPLWTHFYLQTEKAARLPHHHSQEGCS